MKRDKANYFYGVAWFMISLCVCTFNDSITKLLVGGYPVSQIVFLRYLFATISLLPCMLVRGCHTFKTKHAAMHSIRAVMLASAIALYCFSLDKLPLSTVITVNFTIPIFTLLLAYIFLKERVGGAELGATLTCFTGILVTSEPANSGFASYAIVLLVLSAVIFAGLDVINKKFAMREGILTMLFYTATVTLALVAIPAWLNWGKVQSIDWVFFILLGCGANLLLYCILKAFERVTMSAIAPFRYVEFILSAVIGFFCFGEIPTWGTVLGACIIIPSTLYIILTETRSFRRASC
ncbi:MAG: DMT family transporter [Puniceicoccales bacterium]|jgi:drug/metabolite transporter (DMT)-like permease|nr:DMT family transporter [Puniceicoccales bacterium]